MKQNQKNRYNGRYNNNRNQRQMLTRSTPMDSSGPCGRVHGTALQLFEKYQGAAKDALIQNDLVLAETCMQYADHYIRLQNVAIANEQSMRPNNVNQPYKNQADELPTVVVPEVAEKVTVAQEEVAQEKESSQEAQDAALSKMDLSVPVRAIQEKHKEQKQPVKQRVKKELPAKEKKTQEVLA